MHQEPLEQRIGHQRALGRREVLPVLLFQVVGDRVRRQLLGALKAQPGRQRLGRRAVPGQGEEGQPVPLAAVRQQPLQQRLADGTAVRRGQFEEVPGGHGAARPGRGAHRRAEHGGGRGVAAGQRVQGGGEVGVERGAGRAGLKERQDVVAAQRCQGHGEQARGGGGAAALPTGGPHQVGQFAADGAGVAAGWLTEPGGHDDQFLALGGLGRRPVLQEQVDKAPPGRQVYVVQEHQRPWFAIPAL
ncbi:hypothetical protein ACOBQB_14515 [Streptomyces sp. G5(2025)]|uniref:hypothetical protein n=1 Tax=Streptomyces sp. G5(2025) TaxID=3406628 RepID=UPI003C28F492